MSDDDLRFGDISGESRKSKGKRIDYRPVGVAFVVVVILLIGQPLSGSIGSLDMNIAGSLLVAIGGLVAAFDKIQN